MVAARLPLLAAPWLLGAGIWPAPAAASASLRRAGAEVRRAGFPASHTELGKAEADDYRRQFSQLDRDANGKISAAELAKALSAPDEPGQAAPGAEAAEPAPLAKAAEAGGAPAAPAEAAAAPPSAPAPAEPPAPEGPSPGRGAQAAPGAGPPRQPQALAGQEFFKHDLAFVHVPVSFGLAVERAALEGNREEETPFLLYGSLSAKTVKEQWERMESVRGGGGQIWGQMYPELREVSNFSGCNLAYEPPKHWPAEVARAYFGSARAFGLLRDPYDRLVSEFRHQASGGGKQPGELRRSEVSEREGSLERESPEYQALYETCNISRWVKEELKRYRAGDQYRGNCHLLPQAEYFQHPHGVSLPVDVRTLPDSFNLEMERHGYTIRLQAESVRAPWSCGKLSVWDLDEEAKRMIREVYAADFDLLCRHFGYCDREELTCLAQIPFMCGAAASVTS